MRRSRLDHADAGRLFQGIGVATGAMLVRTADMVSPTALILVDNVGIA